MMKQMMMVMVMVAFAWVATAQDIQTLKQQALAGDARAQLQLATRYERGVGVEIDSAEALRWVEQAVAQEYAEAYVRLSQYYLSGRFFPADHQKVFALCREGAEKGASVGIAKMGRCYEYAIGVEKDTIRALNLYQQAAERGDAYGQYCMAVNKYYGSMGVARDREGALALARQSLRDDEIGGYMILVVDHLLCQQYKAAAKLCVEGMEKGSAFCAAEYAGLVFSGNGVKKDEAKALSLLRETYAKHPNDWWVVTTYGQSLLSATDENLRSARTAEQLYQRGCELGSVEAMTTLGHSYLYGDFTEVDEAEALRYYRMAAEAEDVDGEFFTAYILLNKEDESSREEALDLMQRAYEHHNPNAAQWLAEQALAKEKPDVAGAIQYLDEAGEWGNVNCFVSAGKVCEQAGETRRATGLYQKAIDHGMTDGYYYQALVCGQDKMALELLNKGDKAGSRLAQEGLGICYENGIGVKTDLKKAEKYYLKSETDRSLFRLGNLYLTGRLGRNDEEDKLKGLDYMAAAADNGHVDAIYALGLENLTGHYTGRTHYDRALEQFQLLADNDIAEGQYELGYMYENALGVPHDTTMVLHYYTLAAQNGHPQAMCYLGDYYRDGTMVGGKDCDKAAELFHQAAEMGSEGGCFYMGRSYLEGCGVVKDTMLAMPWLWKAGAMGSAGALERLADIYNYGSLGNADSALYYYVEASRNGSGRSCALLGDYAMQTMNNPEVAVSYYERGTEFGNGICMLRLGECYEQGVGMKKADPQTAFELYAEAAKRGVPNAYLQMGQAYLFGQGVSLDESMAKDCFQKAADLGSARGMFNMSICYSHGIGCEPDSVMALRWLKRSAEAEFVTAIVVLGDSYRDGSFGPKDERKAFELYSKAMEMGDLTGMCRVGACYEDGIGVVLNSEQAYTLYTQAAEKGSALGWYLKACCHANGVYVPEDMEETFACMLQASELGHVKATYHVGRMYEKGEGVKADKKKAKKYYQMAASMGSEEAEAALNRM